MNTTTYSFVISSNKKKELLDNPSILIMNNNNPYIEYFIFFMDCKITIYKTQKCVIQGKNAQELMFKYFAEYLNQVKKINEVNDDFDYEKENFAQNIIGSDEVGVGDYFGGLVVCAVFLTPETAKKAESIGVKDSKKISDEKIINIAEKLMKFVRYQISELTPRNYNDLFYSYKNSHVLKTILHYSVIEKLVNDLEKENIYAKKLVIDQYATPEKFDEYLIKAYTHNKLHQPFHFYTKAENKYLAVACASIIARYIFLKQIKKMSNKLNIAIPLGAWNDNIESTAFKLISNHKYNIAEIDDILTDNVKKHFINTDKILKKFSD